MKRTASVTRLPGSPLPSRRRSAFLTSLSLAAISMASIAGCADENSPDTHVSRLADPRTRPAAVNRLIQFFEDGMTRNNQDRNSDKMKALLGKVVVPLSEACVTGDLDERTQSKVIKFLADARDPHAEPCLVKVLKDYKPDATDEDVRWAARGVQAMKLPGAGAALFEAFSKLRPSKPKASGVYRDVHDALLELADPAWEPQLLAMVARPLTDPKEMKDELYWQITAVELLGKMKSQKAVEPLLKVVLSPAKAGAHTDTILALTKIGKPALEPTIALLKSENKALVDYSRVENIRVAGDKPNEAQQKAASVAHIGTAALVLATMGREESVGPLLGALASADDVSRAIIARELAKLPKSPETLKAFQDAYEKTPMTLSIPPGMGARESLLEAASMFFDASLTPWIVKTALEAKGEEGDLAPVRETSLLTALKLMTVEQMSEVEKLYNLKTNGADGKPTTLGKGLEREYKIATELTTSCKANLDCYFGKLVDPKSQTQEMQIQGIKSAYMIGILGGADARKRLLDEMPKIKNAALRFVSVSVIDRLSPKGDPQIAAGLQKIVDDALESKDQEKISGNAPFKTVIYRLSARAQQ